jgi:hypothetical protein
VLAANGVAAARPDSQGPKAVPPPADTAHPSVAGAPPVPREVFSRDQNGGIVIKAVRLTEPIRVDGHLDEVVYQTYRGIDHFIQAVPREGAPATERTEAWVLFDHNNIYVSARCWDSAPPGLWIANEIRRDQIQNSDNFAVSLDTFHDRRNSFVFQTTPLGALADFITTDEGSPNRDWNPVWDVRTARFDGGWSVEMAIPYKSIRYQSGSDMEWGLQLRRGVRRKNEWAFLAPVPAAWGGAPAISRPSIEATLTGLDLPAASRNVELKPYGISRIATDRLKTPAASNDVDGDLGIDAKYGITANLTADVTYNTDFAQVEVDEQQVNLTRFSLFFPEKREFFLEGRGQMDFGLGATGGTGGDTPLLFYSRRIGFNRNTVVPIEVGGRVTGKVGRFGLGLMNIQTGEESVSATRATNFTVVRLKRDVLRRSTVGAIFTNRSVSNVATGANQAYGVDATFAFYQNVRFDGFVARTDTPGLRGDDLSTQTRFSYGADRYGLRLEHLRVGGNFNPEVGFVRRVDFDRRFASARFSPRPKSGIVRKYTWEATLEYFENGAGALESRSQSGRFNMELENSDQFTLEASGNYELVLRPFRAAGVATVPAGEYHFNDATASYLFGQQRRVSGRLSLQSGQYYGGRISTFGFSSARVSVTPQFSVEPSVSITRLTLPHGKFTSSLTRIRADYGLTPRKFLGTLLQYNSADRSFSTNMRFRWEYLPGSELFVVYTDERDTLLRGFPELKNRAFVVKVNRLLRF